jgi:hypothetical protein
VALEVEAERQYVGQLPQGTQKVPNRKRTCQDGMLTTNLSHVR